MQHNRMVQAKMEKGQQQENDQYGYQAQHKQSEKSRHQQAEEKKETPKNSGQEDNAAFSQIVC